MKRISFLAVILLVIVPSVAAAQTPAPDVLTAEQLKNATYSGIYDEAVTLTDGVYEGEPFVEGGASRPIVEYINNSEVYGDLDGDGIDDAVVFLVESGGGSGNFVYVAAQLNHDGQPLDAGAVLIEDRIQIKSASIEGGRVTLEITAHGPGDAACCASYKVHTAYEVQDGRLVEIAGIYFENLTKITAADLDGTSWRLLELDRDQPALDDTEVTISFQDNEISGYSGCNNYRTSFSLGTDNPFAMTTTLIAATRKACPEPILRQESAYFTALQNVSQWGYEIGRLALYYPEENQGGLSWLLFEPVTGDYIEPAVSKRVAAAREPDKAIEAALYTFVGDDYTLAQFPDEAEWVRYHYNLVDLNGDGTDEALVLLSGPLYCGTGGCTLLVLHEEDGTYQITSKMTLVRPPVLVGDQRSNGWNDLIVFVSGGGAESGYRVLSYDGETYPSNPSVEEPLRGSYTATAYLDEDLSAAQGRTLKPHE